MLAPALHVTDVELMSMGPIPKYLIHKCFKLLKAVYSIVAIVMCSEGQELDVIIIIL